MMRHQLHSVTNAQDRNPKRKNLRVEMRRAFIVNAGRAAGENDPFRLEGGHFVRGDIELNDFRVNLRLSNSARDNLRVLRTEIENEDLRMRRRGALRHGCVSLMVGSLERSIGPSVPLPVKPRWNLAGTSSTMGFSSGSAQPAIKIAAPKKKAMEKAFKREGYLRK